MSQEFVARNGIISRGNVVVTGSLTTSDSLTTTGTITATTLVVQTITSSISSITGSTNFGTLSSNTHTFTGSILTSGSITSNGVVTINGASGTYLQVGSATVASYTIPTSIQLDNSYLNATGSNTALKLYLYKNGSETYGFGLNSSAGLEYHSNGYHGIFTTSGSSTVERVRVTNTGNVGIGTITPSYTLDVNGTGRFSSGLNATSSGFPLDLTANSNNYGIKITSVQAPSLILNSVYNTANNRNWGLFTNSQVFGDFDIRQSNAKDGDMTAGANSTSRFYLSNTGAATFSTTVSAYTSINVTNSGAQDSILRATSTYADGYRAMVRLNNTYTGGRDYAMLSSNTSDGVFGTGKFGFYDYTSNTVLGYWDDSHNLLLNPSYGRLWVRTNASLSPGGVSGVSNMLNPDDNGLWALALQNNATTNSYGRGIGIKNTTDFNNSASEFIFCVGNTTPRFFVQSDGGVRNYTANNSNLSDERVKKDIIPIESYWNKFKAIEIVKFKYKDQTHDDFNIGVIAQQVEEIAPEFVNTDGFGGPEYTPEDGIPLKSIYEADLHNTTIKVLQEAMAKIETLEARVQELENK